MGKNEMDEILLVDNLKRKKGYTEEKAVVIFLREFLERILMQNL